MEEFDHLKIHLKDIVLATDNFAPNKLVGGGGFGSVYKGEISHPQGPKTVACKRLDPRFGQGHVEFLKEIVMLSKYKHKNLVSLLHFCIEGDERILVYEYASRGSLDCYLSDPNLKWTQRLKICLGVAHALNYLHDQANTHQRILHRDIKSSNILLDEEWNAKVSDFGLSKIGPANQSQTYLISNAVGTPGYCDPLYWETGILSKESDVYSLGVVLFEVMCGRFCCEYRDGRLLGILVLMWKKCFKEKRLDDIIFHGLKEHMEPDSLNTFSTIAYQCLKRARKERPTMGEIVQKLEMALEQQHAPNAHRLLGPFFHSQRVHESIRFPEDGPAESMRFDDMVENMKISDSKYEVNTGNIGNVGLPSQDNVDLSSLQIIRNDDLEELKELEFGTFGKLYYGKWRGTDVAINRIKKSYFTGRSSEQDELTNEFWQEAVILSKLHHPNVVAFYGVVPDGPSETLATVTEFMVDGSLRLVLLRKDRYLDHRKKLIIAMDAAFGMEYLHSKNIVHFDIKCDNLLVNMKDRSRPICKVGGFGLSKIKRNTLVSGGVRGTLPWMAPELLDGSGNKVSEKVDVLSFGIVLWEILTGEEPYANMHYGAIIGGVVTNTLRPLIPKDCDGEWRRLMEQCWEPNPMARPSFTEIAGRLRFLSHTKPKAVVAGQDLSYI